MCKGHCAGGRPSVRGHGGRIARLQPCRPARPRAANGVRVGAAAAARWQLHRALLVAGDRSGWSACVGAMRCIRPSSLLCLRRSLNLVASTHGSPGRGRLLPQLRAGERSHWITLCLRSETRQSSRRGSLDQTRCIPGYARCERVWAGARRLHEESSSFLKEGRALALRGSSTIPWGAWTVPRGDI